MSAGDRVQGTTSRRAFMAGSVAGLALLPGLRPLAAFAMPADIAFDILRKGEKIGVHEVRFTALGDGDFRAETNVDVAVKLGFITLYRFEQEVTEVWRRGTMVEASGITNDDGEKARLRAALEDGALMIEGPAGRQKAPLGAMTDIAFWNPKIARQDQVVDTWLGQLAPLIVGAGDFEEIELRGRRVRARRFSFTANRGRSGKVWYDEAGVWVRGYLKTPNAELDYLPTA